MLELIKRNLAAFAAADWEAYKADFAPGIVYDEVATGRRVTGADEVVALDNGWKKAFPDGHATVKNFYTGGEGIGVVELEWAATHKGTLETPFGSLPASNKGVKVPAVMICKIVNGKIAEIHHYFDMLSLLRQIGAPVLGVSTPKTERVYA